MSRFDGPGRGLYTVDEAGMAVHLSFIVSFRCTQCQPQRQLTLWARVDSYMQAVMAVTLQSNFCVLHRYSGDTAAATASLSLALEYWRPNVSGRTKEFGNPEGRRGILVLEDFVAHAVSYEIRTPSNPMRERQCKCKATFCSRSFETIEKTVHYQFTERSVIYSVDRR